MCRACVSRLITMWAGKGKGANWLKVTFILINQSVLVCLVRQSQSILKSGYLFINTWGADVCNYFMLIGRLLAVCDVSSGSAVSGKARDVFWLGSKAAQSKLEPCAFSASLPTPPADLRPARVWRSIKTAGPSLCNRLSGPLLQLAFSNELMEMDSLFNVTGQRMASARTHVWAADVCIIAGRWYGIREGV